MNSRNKLIALLIIVLVVANVSTLTFMWLHHPPHRFPPPPPDHQHNAVQFLSEQLNFTAEQSEQLKKLSDDHQHRVHSLLDSIHHKKDAFFDLLGNAQASDSIVQLKANEAAVMQAQLDVATFNHFKAVRALCTDEQKKKFDDVIGDVIRMNAPPPPPLRRPPGPPPPR